MISNSDFGLSFCFFAFEGEKVFLGVGLWNDRELS
jgi:hypothetical protein